MAGNENFVMEFFLMLSAWTVVSALFTYALKDWAEVRGYGPMAVFCVTFILCFIISVLFGVYVFFGGFN